jgi:hypothetical protein
VAQLKQFCADMDGGFEVATIPTEFGWSRLFPKLKTQNHSAQALLQPSSFISMLIQPEKPNVWCTW